MGCDLSCRSEQVDVRGRYERYNLGSTSEGHDLCDKSNRYG